MSKSPHSRLTSPATSNGVADPERLIRTIRRSTAWDTRVETNTQTVELAKQDSDKENNLKKLANRFVSEERSALSGHVAKREESVIVNAASARDTSTGNAYLIKNALTAMMIPSPTTANHLALVERLQ